MKPNQRSAVACLPLCVHAKDNAQVPPLGLGDVTDATCHLLRFVLDLLRVGIIEDKVDLEYINGLDWYHSLLDVLGGKSKATIGAPGFCSSDTA